MFFSVDIETSDNRIGVGHVLSIGAVPVVQDNQGTWLVHGDRFYKAIRHPQLEADNPWVNTPGHWRPGQPTYDWWHAQDPWVLAEALSGTEPIYSVMEQFAEWVRSVAGDEPAYFVANPSSFDYGHLDLAFTQTGVNTPFHYRTVCLRSMRFGLETTTEWGQSRGDTFKSEIPHHALEDAIAQAKDLVALLTMRDNTVMARRQTTGSFCR